MQGERYLFSTLRQSSAEGQSSSYRTMLRAGMIRKISSGIYAWLPTGLRVLRKLERFIREEMERVGALELLLPLVQPIGIWEKSGRVERYGSELLRFFDRGGRGCVLAPTHEEIMALLIGNEIRSYRQLPLILYQIQVKFRDEMRPCSGALRSREFVMKDAYSFHDTEDSLRRTYRVMYRSYCDIFRNLGLKFHVVSTTGGCMDGNVSHKFLAAKSVSFSSGRTATTSSDEVAIQEIRHPRSDGGGRKTMFFPGSTSLTGLIRSSAVPAERTVYLTVVHARSAEAGLLAIMLRGDHSLSRVKVEDLEFIDHPLRIASEEEIRSATGFGSAFLGPLGLPLDLIADHSVALMDDFIAGANSEGRCYAGIGWGRDLPLPEVFDLRESEQLPSLGGGGENFVEVGQIFQLGTKYTGEVGAHIRMADGTNRVPLMGCYGIGVTRLVAVLVGQHSRGGKILWPKSVVPFQVVILPAGRRSEKVRLISEEIYRTLKVNGVDVMLRHGEESLGEMVADAELIGIPCALVVDRESFSSGTLECRDLLCGGRSRVKIGDAVSSLIDRNA